MYFNSDIKNNFLLFLVQKAKIFFFFTVVSELITI